MADIRESIILRLVAIATGVTGIRKVTRNSLAIDDTELPAIAILDADETATSREGGNQPLAYIKVTLQPQVLILLRDDPLQVGPSISVFRNRLVKAVTSDADLYSLVGKNGGVAYLGMQTGLGAARSMRGEAAMLFGFSYVLRPGDL